MPVEGANIFQLLHAIIAVSFAASQLFLPWLYGYVTTEPLPAVGQDCIRWCSPFCFGFGLLSFVSPSMRRPEREQVCRMYSISFALSVLIMAWTQLNGRWNVLLDANIAPFAGLLFGYIYFASRLPDASLKPEDPIVQLVSSVWPIAPFVDEACDSSAGSVLGGPTLVSKGLDVFVAFHSAAALAFASIMALKPQTFGALTVTGDLPPLAQDIIRMSAPFVIGFGILAAMSLRMRAPERWKIACIYTLALSVAFMVSILNQLMGRWNATNWLAPWGFASLASCYGIMAKFHPDAFLRAMPSWDHGYVSLKST